MCLPFPLWEEPIKEVSAGLSAIKRKSRHDFSVFSIIFQNSPELIKMKRPPKIKRLDPI
jgi:hypothetical protein